MIETEHRKPIVAALRCFNQVPYFVVDAYGVDFVQKVAEPKSGEDEYQAAIMEEMPDRRCTKLPQEQTPPFTISFLPKQTKPAHANDVHKQPGERLKI